MYQMFEKAHGLACHVPKCKEDADTPMLNRLLHGCGECSLAFSTRRGLSQHERHRNPSACLSTRRRSRLEDIARKRSLRNRRDIWTHDEVRLLRQLMIQYEHAKKINIKIAEHFNHKTAKQVKHKRRALREKDMALGAPQGAPLPLAEEPVIEVVEGAREEERLVEQAPVDVILLDLEALTVNDGRGGGSPVLTEGGESTRDVEENGGTDTRSPSPRLRGEW